RERWEPRSRRGKARPARRAASRRGCGRRTRRDRRERLRDRAAPPRWRGGGGRDRPRRDRSTSPTERGSESRRAPDPAPRARRSWCRCPIRTEEADRTSLRLLPNPRTTRSPWRHLTLRRGSPAALRPGRSPYSARKSREPADVRVPPPRLHPERFANRIVPRELDRLPDVHPAHQDPRDLLVHGDVVTRLVSPVVVDPGRGFAEPPRRLQDHALGQLLHEPVAHART